MAGVVAVDQLVLLVTLDCCRADHFSCNGYPRSTTPALDGLAGDGVNFSRAFSTAGVTPHSLPGIFLSNFYQNFGRSRVAPHELGTLAEAFSASGWHTIGLSAGDAVASHLYGYDRGFAEFRDFVGDGTETVPDSRRLPPPGEMERFRADCREHPEVCEMIRRLTGATNGQLVRSFAGRPWHLDAGPMVDTLIDRISDNAHRGRVFGWLHLMDVHEPVYVRRSRLGRFGPASQQLLNAWSEVCKSEAMLEDAGLGPGSEQMAGKYAEHYDSALSYVDLELERLLNFLHGEGLFDRSLVCVTADHGQDLFEDDIFGHWFGRPMSQRLVRVPLIFGGGLADPLADHSTQRIVSTLDVGPTLLDLCDVPAPDSFLGRSLADDTPRPAFGQSFYDGIDPRGASDDLACIRLEKGPGRYRVGPYPAPVRECLHEMGFCARDGRMFRYDTGRDEEVVLDLEKGGESKPGVASRQDLAEQARNYFNSVYHPAKTQSEGELCGAEKENLVKRLRGLGYL